MMIASARTVSIVGFVAAISLVVTLHILRTDISPAAGRLSEYANGPYGWMMTTSFVALGCGLIMMGVVLQSGRSREWRSWASPALAFSAGAATILSGIFPTEAPAADESIHSPASAVAVVAVVTLALAHSTRSAGRRSGWTRDPAGTGLALGAFVLAALSPVIHHTRWTGFGQRALWIVLATWLLRAAWIDARQTTPSQLPIGADHDREISARRDNASDWAKRSG